MIPFLAPLLLKLSPIKAALSKIPRPVWIALAVVAILLLGTCAHKRSVKKFGEERYAAGVKAEGERIAKKAEAIKAKADALTSKISTTLRKRNDETNRRIVSDANSLLVRGPGKASCPGYSGVPSPASGHVAPARPSDAPLASVPDGERINLIALPFAPTVGFGRQHDQCQADLKSYREWEIQIREAWKQIK